MVPWPNAGGKESASEFGKLLCVCGLCGCMRSCDFRAEIYMKLLGEVHVQNDRECQSLGHSFEGLLLHFLTTTVVSARIRLCIVKKKTKVERKVSDWHFEQDLWLLVAIIERIPSMTALALTLVMELSTAFHTRVNNLVFRRSSWLACWPSVRSK